MNQPARYGANTSIMASVCSPAIYHQPYNGCRQRLLAHGRDRVTYVQRFDQRIYTCIIFVVTPSSTSPSSPLPTSSPKPCPSDPPGATSFPYPVLNQSTRCRRRQAVALRKIGARDRPYRGSWTCTVIRRSRPKAGRRFAVGCRGCSGCFPVRKVER